jgi:hypothetical protein
MFHLIILRTPMRLLTVELSTCPNKEGDWMEASEEESDQEDPDDDIDVVDEEGDLELRDEDEEEEEEDTG